MENNRMLKDLLGELRKIDIDLPYEGVEALMSWAVRWGAKVED